MNQLGKLLNRILGSRILITVYKAQLRVRMLNRSASLAMSTSVLETLTGSLDIKLHSPTAVPTKSDSDVILCLQLLSKALTCILHLS